MIKTTVIATALFATAPLFANTTASGQINGSADVSTENQGLFQNVSQGVSNTANKVGSSIENGVDHTKSFTQEKWQDTKNFTSEKSDAAKEKTRSVKDKASDKSNSVKHSAQNQWNKTKTALTPESKKADAETKSNLDVNTPFGGAEANVHTDGSIKTQ